MRLICSIFLCFICTTVYAGAWYPVHSSYGDCKIWIENSGPGTSWGCKDVECKNNLVEGQCTIEWDRGNGSYYRITSIYHQGKSSSNGKGTYINYQIDTGPFAYREYEVGEHLWVYEGDFKDGYRDGTGTITYIDGGKFEGQFSKDLISGKGTMIYPDSRNYTGEWLDNKKSGTGIMIYPSGESYSGSWLNDEKHGKGTTTLPDGSSYEAIWEHGRRIKIF